MDSLTIQEAITGFLSSLNSEFTRHSYGTPLNHFVQFLSELGIVGQTGSTSALTVDHAIRFADHIKARGYKKATVQLYLTAIQQFYGHLIDRDLIADTSQWVKLQRVYRKARDIRGEERPIERRLEVVAATILAARAVEVKAGPGADRRALIRRRDIAIVEALRATGCRVGELVGLHMSDLGPDQQCALVKGKGTKYRQVYFDDLAWSALRAYLRARGLEEGQNVPLFVGHHASSTGAALTTRSVDRVIRRLGKMAGIGEDVTPHYFRHVFATRALGKTENLAVVQDLLGHASPATTRHYARTDEKQRQTAHGQVWA